MCVANQSATQEIVTCARCDEVILSTDTPKKISRSARKVLSETQNGNGYINISLFITYIHTYIFIRSLLLTLLIEIIYQMAVITNKSTVFDVKDFEEQEA